MNSVVGISAAIGERVADGWAATARPNGESGEHVGACLSSSEIIGRLEEAGSTLLALPNSGYSTRLKVSKLEFAREAREVFGVDSGRIRPPVPSAAHISRMDEALAWMQLIPQSRYVLRRIVGARCLVNPVTARHLFSWRKLAAAMGADHKAVQRWHADGIALVGTALANAGIIAR